MFLLYELANNKNDYSFGTSVIPHSLEPEEHLSLFYVQIAVKILNGGSVYRPQHGLHSQ